MHVFLSRGYHVAGPGPSESAYPLPSSGGSLQIPDDFAMSLDMMQPGPGGTGTGFPGGMAANGLGPTPSQDQFWEEWVRDAPESGASGMQADADMFNRIPSSVTAGAEPQMGGGSAVQPG